MTRQPGQPPPVPPSLIADIYQLSDELRLAWGGDITPLIRAAWEAGYTAGQGAPKGVPGAYATLYRRADDAKTAFYQFGYPEYLEPLTTAMAQLVKALIGVDDALRTPAGEEP